MYTKRIPTKNLLREYQMEDNKRTLFNPMDETPRTSLRAPIVRSETHKSEVLSCNFDPSGRFITSSDRQGEIHICDVDGTHKKLMVMKGHTGAVMETHFSEDGIDVYSCSTDGTLGIWDVYSGIRKSKLEGHTNEVNSIQVTAEEPHMLCSGSKDGTVRIWDIRDRECITSFEAGAEVTATCFDDMGDYVFSGGVDNDIKIWDIRRNELLSQLQGHEGKVTGISLSPRGTALLTHSVDNTLRLWDIRPFSTSDVDVYDYPSNHEGVDRLLRCAWSPDGQLISAGTAENDVFVWRRSTGELLHELPGHESFVNDVAFHPTEPILASVSSDNYLIFNEIYRYEY